jgi:outer membrane protein TolC
MARRPWQRICGGLLAAWLVLHVLWTPQRGRAQRDAPLPPPRPIENMPLRQGKEAGLEPPGPPILPANFGGYLPPAIPVTLDDVLKLAILGNLDIVQARLVVDRARANLLRARAQFLPNLNMGSTYVTHDGQIQNTAGNVQTVDRDSLFVGFGPSLTLDVSSALFGPDEARKVLTAARYGELRVTNDTLLRVADAYFAVLRIRRQLARLDETLDFLTSKQESPLRRGSKGLLPLIIEHVKGGVGTALPSDQARVEADVVRFTEERVRTLEGIRVTSAELARLLHLDPQVFLLPCEDYRWPLSLPGGMWFDQPIYELVGLALRSRPELAENQALIEAAVARYRTVKFRPLLPTLALNYSFGGFGGGPAVVGKTKAGANILGNSGVIADFGTRDDFDISLIWRLQNMGLGNLYQIRDARVQLEQAQVFQVQLQDRVITQIVQAMEQIERGKQRVELTAAGLFDKNRQPDGAIYRSLRLNFHRIFQGAGRPLEVQDSIRRLSDVLQVYGNALTDLDQARFRLLFALGMPATALIDPAQMPLPLCPSPMVGKPTGSPPPTTNAPCSPAPAPGTGQAPNPPAPTTPAPGPSPAPASPPTVLPPPKAVPEKAAEQKTNHSDWRGVPLPPIAAPASSSALPPRRIP